MTRGHLGTKSLISKIGQGGHLATKSLSIISTMVTIILLRNKELDDVGIT